MDPITYLSDNRYKFTILLHLVYLMLQYINKLPNFYKTLSNGDWNTENVTETPRKKP